MLCKDLGEQELTVTVQNGVTSKNKFPATSTSSVRFVMQFGCISAFIILCLESVFPKNMVFYFIFRFACAQPVGLHLTPKIRHPEDLPPCPIPPDSPDAVGE